MLTHAHTGWTSRCVLRLGSLLLSSACLAGSDPATPPSRKAFEVQTEREGLPQRYVQALAMDRKGRLWAGTLAGVACYQGDRWRTVETPPSTSGTFVNSGAITPLSDGSVWIGTRYQGILEFREGAWRVHDTTSGSPSNNVNAVLESVERDRAGASVVWAAHYGPALARWADGAWTRFAGPNGRQDGYFFCLLERRSPEGRPLLYAGGTQGVWLVEQDRVRPFEGNDRLPNPRVRVLAETLDGDGASSLWLGLESHGLCRWKNGRMELISLQALGGSDLVRGLLRDPRPGGDALWVATSGGGLGRYENGRWTWMNDAAGLPSTSTRALLITPGGRHGKVLWIGTEGQGVLRYAGDGWNRVILPWQGPDQRAQCFWETPDPDGGRDPVLWIGGAVQGLLRFHRGTWTEVKPGQDRPLDNVRLLYSFPGEQDLFVATFNGLGRLRGGRFQAFGSAEGLPTSQVRALTGTVEAGRRVLWVGTGRGLLRWEGARFETIPNPTLAPDGAIRAITPDGRRLWVGTEHGLACLEDGRWLDLPVLKKVAGRTVNAILLVPRVGKPRELWLSGFGSGVLRIQDPDGQAVVEELKAGGVPGLPHDLVRNLETDDQGRVYIATTAGLARYTDTPAGLLRDDYAMDEGLPTPECTAGGVWKDHAGRIWVGTQDGVAFLVPESRSADAPASALAWTSAAMDGRPLTPGAEFDARHQALHFEFCLWTYYREQDTRYRVQLAGLQAAPGDWKPERTVDYLSLPAGRYTLLVWAKDWAGRVSGPIPFDFRVRPAPWATPWAFIGYAGLLALAVFLLLRLRTRILAQRNADLERRVQEATAEVRSQKQALESLTAELVDLNTQKNDFMGIVAHDLRNPLSGIVLSVDLLEDEDDLQEVRRTLRRIKEQSHSMAYLIGRFLDVNRIETGRMKAEVQPLDLGAFLEAKLLEYQGRAAAKGIALSLERGPEALDVIADPGFLAEIVDNLVSNALKFSPSDRRVTVRLEAREGLAQMAVVDQGPGLTAEDQRKLFGRFARLSARPTGGESSVGLGLSIVKHMVEAMGGRIRAESEPGHGATFIVELPRPS